MRTRFRALLTGAALALAAAPVSAQHLAGGWHLGGPTRASLAVGAWFPSESGSGADGGPVLLAEPGLRGTRLSLGYAVATGGLGSFVSARASVLRLHDLEQWNTYAGVEVQVLPLFATGLRLGAFRPTTRGRRGLLWIGDVSLGL